MARALTVLLVILTTTLLAGCTSQSTPPATSSTAPVTPTDETGSIRGTVVNEETLPIAGVELALLQVPQPVRTDESGAFAFEGLTPGEYDLVAQRLGYESAARKVTVVAGEMTDVTLTLTPIKVDVSYVEGPYVFDGHIQAGGLLLDVLVSDLSSVTGVGACAKCNLYFNTTEDVHEIVFELKFTPTITKPTGDNILEFQLWSLDDEGGLDANYATDDWSSGAKRSFNRETAMAGGDAPMPEKPDNFLLFSYCEATFACSDQRFQIYYTIFHGRVADEDFSALPKE